MNDFQRCERMVFVFYQPRVCKLGIFRYFSRNRAIAFPQYPNKEGTATLNPIQADFQHLAMFSFLFSDTPAQVNVNQIQSQLCHPLPQFGEDHPDQVVPLGMHITEGAADKYSNGSPGLCQEQMPLFFQQAPLRPSESL